MRAFLVLLEIPSLTAAADVLQTSQPALSKTLGKLRLRFEDPLFVRVGHAMQPTPKAIGLAQPVRELLAAAQALQKIPTGFDPRSSDRTFRIFISDSGVIRLLPQLAERVALEAPNLRLVAVPLDSAKFRPKLESGAVDLAIGSFPALLHGIRRKRLFTESYLSVLRADHPAFRSIRSRKVFLAQRHVLITSSDTGHAGQQVEEQEIGAQVAPRQVVLRVPSFVAAALVAKRTNAIATMPAKVARLLAAELDLRVIEPPLTLPRFEIALYWHERFDRDPCNRWIRSLCVDVSRS